MGSLKKWFSSLLIAFCIMSVFAPEAFAKANKGVTIKMKCPVAVDAETDNSLHYFVGALQKKKTKATKNMKVSCKIYIPTSALKEKGDFVIFDPMTYLTDGKQQFYGTIFSKRNVQLELAGSKKKPTLYWQTDEGVGAKLKSKNGTVKKKKGFYVVTLKKIPLCDWAFEGTPDTKIDIKTDKSVYLSTQVRIFRRGSKAWTGNVFVDDLTIHAKKTLKMKFDKKDYKEVFCYKFTNETVKAKVKKIK